MLWQNCLEGHRGPLSTEGGILTALSCTGDVPEGSCPPDRLLLLRLRVHLRLGLSLHLPLTPSSPQNLQCQLGSSASQVSREDHEDNFSHVDVWQCRCLSVSVSSAFITASLFPGTSHRVPSARCQGQLFSLLRAARYFSLWWLISHPSSLLDFQAPLHLGLFSLCFASFNCLVHLPIATFEQGKIV